MPSPFPGMDPYIEDPQRWPDFHGRFITALVGGLQPLLRPKYVATAEERVYVAETERLIRPDVAVIRASHGSPGGTAVASVEPDVARVFAVELEDIHESYIQIVDTTNQRRVVTAIEVLSPKNKRKGPGRQSYLQKCRELSRSGANFVEIDLLRGGRSALWTNRVTPDALEPFHYSVVVTRRKPLRQEVYTTTVRQRLPRVAIPLGPGDADVTLHLQTAFNRCWDEGPYPELLNYAGLPPGRMSDEDAAWCVDLLREKQLR